MPTNLTDDNRALERVQIERVLYALVNPESHEEHAALHDAADKLQAIIEAARASGPQSARDQMIEPFNNHAYRLDGLETCPACGAANVWVRPWHDARRQVECHICQACSPVKCSDEEVKEAWNRLPRSAPREDERDAVSHVLDAFMCGGLQREDAISDILTALHPTNPQAQGEVEG